MKSRYDLSRRGFLGSLTAFAALGPGRAFSAPAGTFAYGTPNLAFGLLSDIHISLTRPAKDGKPAVFRSKTVRQTLKFFAKENVDAVVVAGDIANSGLCEELGEFMSCWRDAFPGDRAADGRHVEKICIFGNHDDSWTMARRQCKDDDEARARALCVDRAKWWKEIMGEEFQPVYRKTVKGYDFVCAHWYKGVCKGKDDAHNAEMRPFYEKIGPTLDAKKPFFHVQHPHPRDTVHGPAVWGQDDGTAGEILSRHPNAIALSGHSHNSLLDDRAIWQGAYTSVATSTGFVVGTGAFGGCAPKCGFENGKRNPWHPEYDRMKTMPASRPAEQGQIVRVYGDRIVFSRYDLADMSPLSDDVVLPLSDARPFAFEPRRAAAKAPAFPAGASLAVRTCTAKLRDAKKDDAPVPALEITIPAALAEPTAPGVRFEIVAKGADGQECRFAALHDSWRYAATNPRVKAPLVFSVPVDRLPKGETSVAVTAYSWWGKASAPLVTRLNAGV